MASKLPVSVPAVTIDRQCGSSQQSIHFAAQAVMSGTQDLVIAAGVESMSRVPMGTPVFLPLQAGIVYWIWRVAVRERRALRAARHEPARSTEAPKRCDSRSPLTACGRPNSTSAWSMR